MGITAGLGFKYHLESIARRVHEGDIVVAVPEYHHFQRDVFDGSLDLPEAIFEFDKASLLGLDKAHLLHLLKMIPDFASKKTFALFKVFELKKLKRRAQQWRFNAYGDFIAHEHDPQHAQPYAATPTSAHPESSVIAEIAAAARSFKDHGVTFILLPPPLQDSVFDADASYIAEIQVALAKDGLAFAADPVRYRIISASLSLVVSGKYTSKWK